MQLFYVIKEELKISNICWWMWMYTPHTFEFIKLQSYGSLHLQWVHGYLIIKYFPSTCQLCLAHTDITTSAYIYGHRKSWRYKDLSSITYLRLSKGDFITRMLILLRSIPGIRGRFIPHKECQESGVNVTSWYSPSIISMYKKNLDYLFIIIFAIFCK